MVLDDHMQREAHSSYPLVWVSKSAAAFLEVAMIHVAELL